MTLPAGLAVQLVASEPMIRQPVAMEFDDAGRLWVIQYLQYPNPAELKRAKVDRYSRTTYDRVPEPPPRGPRGADRITILEDTDHDGVADSSHDFIDGLNLASGLAFGRGGVFVLQVPYLLFYADRDRDDRPDGDPEVLLTGFGMEDAHSVANSLTWGPDGWLYGCQGSTVTSNIRGIEFQQGVWRYHPLSKTFELYCEGGGNSWGLDFDTLGNLFYSTNYGGNALLHGVQGAYYWKQFGKHGALHNPHAYGYFDHVPHQDLRGGHVTVGGIIYQGDSLPQFRGKYIAADLLGHGVNWHELTPRGTSFSARMVGELLQANDTSFAPSDVTVGPDGSIYVSDWNDSRTAHPDPDAQWDRTNGRIYRIHATNASHDTVPNPASLTSEQLVGTLSNTNNWLARKANRMLADRRDPTVVPGLRAQALDGVNEPWALQALWALHVSGGLLDDLAEELLASPHEHVRAWTIRLLGDAGKVAKPLATKFAELAKTDPCAVVRSQLACTAKRLPPGQALPILAGLITHDEDAGDSYLPLLVWWGLEQHAIAARDEVVSLFVRPESGQRALVKETILPRLVRRYAAEATEPGYLAAARLLKAARAEQRLKLLAALDQGLSDRAAPLGGAAGTLFADQAGVAGTAKEKDASTTVVNIPPALAAEIDRGWANNTTDLTMLRLATRLARPAARQRALEIATDQELPNELRIGALQVIGDSHDAAAATSLLELLNADQPAAVQAAALDALSQFDNDAIGVALLEQLNMLSPALRTKCCEALLARRNWAGKLLARVDSGALPAKDVPLDALRLAALHHDAQLDALVKKHWGAIQSGTPEERLAEMRRINNDLRAAPGDKSAGKLLFAKHCGTCHELFGEGTRIGPELTHANRKKTDELLATIVSPSAMIRREYLNFLLQTTDGRVLNGLLVEQSPSAVTLLGAKNERTTVARERVETLVESEVSLMPENLLSPLKPQELRDLFSYLQSDGPSDPAPISTK